MKFGVIGYGSIGKRHVRNLLTLGYDDIVLLRNVGSGNEFDLAEVTEFESLLDTQPNAVIIANPTSLHASYLELLLARNLNVLVEKPLVSSAEEWQTLKDQLVKYTGIGMTAYNMHFHPCVRFVKKILGNKGLGKIYTARFFVGQYLPDWQPGTDYSKSYSASREMGGGVLFDLIHEIDLACYLVGEPVGRIACQVNKVSDLQIETEDLAELLYLTDDNSFVSIHLDYLTRGYQRYIEITLEQGSLRADLFSNKVIVTSESGKADKKSFPEFSRNDMYLDMLTGFINCIEEKNAPLVSLQEGLISNQISINIRNEFYHGNS